MNYDQLKDVVESSVISAFTKDPISVKPALLKSEPEDDPKELAVIEAVESSILFGTTDGIASIIQPAIDYMMSIVPDISTESGRKAIKSRAYKISRLKTKIDEYGKDSVADYKKKLDAVNAERRIAKQLLDDARDAIKKPVVEYEEAIKKAEEERLAAIEAEQIQKEINDAHEVAIVMNELFDMKQAQMKKELEEAEKKRIAEEIAEYDRAVKEEAAKIVSEVLYFQNNTNTSVEVIDDHVDSSNASNDVESESVLKSKSMTNKQIQLSNIKKDFMNVLSIDETLAREIVLAIARNQINNVVIKYNE